MARQRKTSLLSDLMSVSLKIPLWANVLVAGGTFALLHHYGGSELPTMRVAPGRELAEGIVLQIGSIFAYLGQYLIPPIFLLGGGIGSIKRYLRARKFRSIARSSDIGAAIRDLSWYQFEQMIGEAFRKQSYTVQETAIGPDGGIDLVLKRGGEIFLVQCKHWKAQRVSVQVVRELYGVMSARGAVGGFVVTSGTYTKDAKKFAAGTSVELVDGTLLVQWFKAANPSNRSVPPMIAPVPVIEPAIIASTPAESEEPSELAHSSDTSDTQVCPRCGSGMTPRYARAMNGGISSNVFLGCLNFPACRGTRQVKG